MKNFFMTMCLLLCSIVAMASNPLKAIEGKKNLSTIMRSKGKALIVFDWSEAKYDKDKDLKEKLGNDYDFVLSDCEKSFIKGFNEKSKKIKLAKDASEATYKFILKVTCIDRYFSVMSFVPKHEAKMWGSLEIVDVKTKESLVKITIDEAEDGKDFVPRECFGKTFFNLAERVAKLK